MHSLVNKDVVKRAFNIVLPSIKNAMEIEVVKRKVYSVNVLNPYKKFGECGISEAFLLVHNVGNPNKWEYPFNEIAIGKSVISWRTGLSSQVVHAIYPNLLVEGDVKYYGNAVLGDAELGKIIVSISGFQPYYDQMFSEMIAFAIKAICLDEVNAEVERTTTEHWLFNKSDISFVGEI